MATYQRPPPLYPPWRAAPIAALLAGARGYLPPEGGAALGRRAADGGARPGSGHAPFAHAPSMSRQRGSLPCWFGRWSPQTHEQGRRDDSAGRAEPRRRAGTSELRLHRRSGSRRAPRGHNQGYARQKAARRGIDGGYDALNPVVSNWLDESAVRDVASFRHSGASVRSVFSQIASKLCRQKGTRTACF